MVSSSSESIREDSGVAHAEFLRATRSAASGRHAASGFRRVLRSLPSADERSRWQLEKHQASSVRQNVSNQKASTVPLLVSIFENLKLVADNFVTLQQQRHSADYDNSKT
jgi:hypothetical protein